MRYCLALGGVLLAGTASAQEPQGAAAPLLFAQAAPAVSTDQGSRMTEFERSLEFVYAEVDAIRRDQKPSPQEMLAVGAGAGVGFVLGSLTGGALVVPAVAGAATTAGMGAGWANAFATAVSTVTSVGFTLGGGRPATPSWIEDEAGHGGRPGFPAGAIVVAGMA